MSTDASLTEIYIRVPFDYPHTKRVVANEILRFREERGALEIQQVVTSNVILRHPTVGTYSVFYCHDYGSDQFGSSYLLQESAIITPDTDLDTLNYNFTLEEVSDRLDRIFFPASGQSASSFRTRGAG